jgi:hypothetical protein
MVEVMPFQPSFVHGNSRSFFEKQMLSDCRRHPAAQEMIFARCSILQ